MAALDGRHTLAEVADLAGLDLLAAAQIVLALDRAWLVDLQSEPASVPLEAEVDELVVDGPRAFELPEPPAAGATPPATPADALRERILAEYARLPHVDHFALLGVEPGVRGAELAAAFAGRVAEFGPDRLGDHPDPELKRMAQEIYLRLVRAYETLRDPAAQEAYQRVLRLREEERRAGLYRLGSEERFREGRLHLDAGDPETAEACFREAGRLNRQEPVYALYAGWAAYLAGRADGDPSRMESGERQVERALSVLPILDEGYVFLARMAEARGDTSRARDLYERALLFNPSSAEAKEALVRLELDSAGSAGQEGGSPV